MRRTISVSALWMIALGASGVEAADGGHFYAGVAAGRSSVDGRARTDSTIFGPSDVLTSVTVNGLPFDDESTAWSGFVGYAATPYVGVELGYWDHGDFDMRRFAGQERVSLSIQEAYFGATLRYPIFKALALTCSAGISRAQFDTDGALLVAVVLPPRTPFIPIVPVIPTRLPLSTPKDETGGYWRVGLSWQFNPSWEVAFNYGRRDLKVQEVDNTNLALIYNF